MDHIEDANVVIDFRGGKDAARKYRQRIEELKAMKQTLIYCTASDCLRNKEGKCTAETIHLQSCTPDMADVFACSEFEE